MYVKLHDIQQKFVTCCMLRQVHFLKDLWVEHFWNKETCILTKPGSCSFNNTTKDNTSTRRWR